MVQTFLKRPTSPLFYEPLYTLPEEILYPGSDEEATPDEREKKRVRVEIQGQQYLNGRPLFIQTARLRGPFEKGWVNPWKCKERKYAIDDIRRFPQAEQESFPERPHRDARPSTAKRRSAAGSGYGSLDHGPDAGVPSVTETSAHEKPTAKRRRHEDHDELHGYNGSQRQTDLGFSAPNNNRHHWLKTDNVYPRARIRDDARSSTPTPAAKPRSKSHATSSPSRKDLGRAITLPPNPNLQKRILQSNEHVFDVGGSHQSTTPAAREEAPVLTVELATTELRPCALDAVYDVRSNVRERSLSTTETITRYGHNEAKRLSQGAARRAEVEDGQCQAKKRSEAAATRMTEGHHMKITSRLTPYVSEADPGNDAASSGALRAAKVPRPKPSPHALPPSTYQPEFQYHYSKKSTSVATSPQSAPFVDAPEQPQARPRSDSSSSSGSSAFAKALEAAQEKAASKSFASSKSASPAIEGPETKSVKKNRQALRRLTFTPSGGAKVASARTSSRPSSSSSVVDPGKAETNHRDKPLSNDPPSLHKTSTKSSARSLTNGYPSRNSIVFPEAQTDPIVRPPITQAPSGPSTDLLETDKQSPKVESLDEGDSYLDLSTQAAVWKAQSSFQADVVSALTPNRPKKEDSSPIALGSRKAGITPMAHGHRDTELANAQLIKASGSDDEEPMSTQAMVDAISPFAITTIKKRPPAAEHRLSVVPSPTKKGKAKSPPPPPPIFPLDSPPTFAFRTHSPSMSTSPSPSPTPPPPPEKSPPPIPLSHPTTNNSKPPSSLTSFSVLPNGTLTETSLYQHDGQQQEDIPDYDISLPIDPFGFADATAGGGGSADGHRPGHNDTWDLNTAIDEAGSFLGDWDVETEARKEGSLSRKREEASRGILKGSA